MILIYSASGISTFNLYLEAGQCINRCLTKCHFDLRQIHRLQDKVQSGTGVKYIVDWDIVKGAFTENKDWHLK